MKIKPYKRRQNSDFFELSNNNKNIFNIFNIPGKIEDKLITINIDNNNIQFPKENRIKELEISLKPSKNINKSCNFNKTTTKAPSKNEPYLKPKFQLKNRNSFYIHNNKKKNNNEEIKDINMNLFKIYYDEKSKKFKIIKNKSNDKTNKNEYLIQKLKQKNKFIYKVNENNKTNKKIKNNNFDNGLLTNKHSNNKDLNKIKYLYSDTPSQSTTDTKSKKTQTKNETTNSKGQSHNKIKSKKETNGKNKVSKHNNNIYYENLPSFLQRKKKYTKNSKTYKELDNKNKILDNNGKLINKEKAFNNINKDLLIKKINFNNIDNDMTHKKKIEKNYNKEINKKEFTCHKNNFSLNMTYDKGNLKKIFEPKNINFNNNNNSGIQNIKKLYISSVKTRNTKDERKTNINKFDNINSYTQNNNNYQRKTYEYKNNYLYHFFKDRKNEFIRNKSLGNNFFNNENSYSVSKESSFLDKPNLSFNNNLFRNKFIKSQNNVINDLDESIINKTKNILKLNSKGKYKEAENICDKNFSKTSLLLNNFVSNFERYPKRIIQQSHKNFREKIINIPNISYLMNSKAMSENERQNLFNNTFNRNKRPCSLYLNKNLTLKEKNILHNNISLNDYYNNAVYKNNNLTINNINISPNNLGFNNRNIGGINKNYATFDNKKEIEMNKLSKNTNLKKYFNSIQYNSSENLINQKINNSIFKFNRNKSNNIHSHNTSLNYIPSILSLNRAIIG